MTSDTAMLNPAKRQAPEPLLGRSDLHRIALGVSRGDGTFEILRQKRDDVLTARADAPGGSVIVKLWSRSGVKGLLRRATLTAAADREWRALTTLGAHGLAVPRGFGRIRLDRGRARHTDAVIMQDLGQCERASERIQAAARSEDWREVDRLTEHFLDSTQTLVEAGFADPDHRVTNFVVDRSGQIYRLDLELAQRPMIPIRSAHQVGITLGVLIGSYAFCLNPHVDRVSAFAGSVVSRTSPGDSALRVARTQIEWMLDDQRTRYGVDMKVDLPF